eukprot:jgi/Psemu1/28411/gm1.28411_g
MYMKQRVLYRDLPSLNRPLIPASDPMLTLAVTALTDQQLKLSEGLDQTRTHIAAAIWGPLCTKCLLLLCRKRDESNLPLIYPAWAQKSKHEKTHMIFQSQVASRAAKLEIQPPLVTTAPSHTPGGSADTLKQEQEVAANVAAYNTMISTEGNSLTFKDSLELQKTKVHVPLDWTEATTQLESYLAVLATILGATHAVVEGGQNKMGELITPAIVVYYFLIRVRAWLEEQWESDFTIASPDFGEEIHWFQITQNLNWLPSVFNVCVLRVLRKTNPPPAKGGNNNSTNSSNAGGNNSSSQDQLTNTKRDTRFKDSGKNGIT